MLSESSFLIACRPKKFDQIVVSWDLASTAGEASSYSVAEVWGKAEGRHYLMHVWRSKGSYSVVKPKHSTFRNSMALAYSWLKLPRLETLLSRILR
jgi:phage terminase large subunit-like protein